jgi:ketosteroid isomerase-like protein
MTPKDIVLRYYDEVWRKGNVDAIDELLAEDHVDETPPPGFDGTRESQKQLAAIMRDTSKDKTVEIIDVVAEGDHVAGAWRMAWTQIGDLWGMVPADGTRLELDGLDCFELRDGRIVRTRHVENWLGVLIQLGALPA